MGIVNRYSAGFLSLLDSQTQGDTPSVSIDSIQPSMRMEPYLCLAKGYEIVRASQVQNTVAAGGANLIVPAGEAWMVHHVSGQMIAQDGISGVGTPTLELQDRADLSFPLQLTQGPAASFTVAGHWIGFAYQPSFLPMMLNSGSVLTMELRQAPVPATGVGWAMVLKALITRLSA